MATRLEYALSLREQAKHAPSNEWRIVMQFYAALHITGHVLYGTGPAITKHERHSSALEAHDSGRVIAREYEALRQLSEAARYRPAEHPMDSMTSFADRMVEAIFHHCSPD